MRISQIYIEGNRLDLFDDEQIKVQSSVQDVFSIESSKTDFTQSFTVPASENNNQIFNHFYNSDVDSFNGVTLNYNIRRNAHIEIDLVPFKTGKIQLEKSTILDNQVQNYQICFYGDLVSLKDILGETKLSELDYSAYTHVYNESNVIDRVCNNTAYDVRYPLISSLRVWDYNGPDNTNNIDVNAGAINVNELFPSIRISSIFQAIQNYFDITLDSLFAQTKNFYNAYLYLKNKDVFSFRTPTEDIVYADVDNTTYLDYSTNAVLLFYRTDKFTTIYENFGNHNVKIKITPSNTTQQYFIDVYSNGTLLNTIVGIGVNTYDVMTIANVSGLNQSITFKIRASVSMNIYSEIYYRYYFFAYDSGADIYYYTSELYTATTATFPLIGSLDINSNMPQMKVYDFLTGVLREFNMVIYGNGANTWKAEPLENWYAMGNSYDITEFTDVTSIDIERVKLYKRISFEHEKSESFMNRVFADNFAREYGSLDYVFTYDADELNIKLPFENILFQQFETTNIHVAYCLTKFPDYKPYIPKPTILYLYDEVTCDPFKFELGSGHVTKTSYLPFGQDLINNAVNYSLNFGNDISSLLNTTVPNSNFMVYYYTYLNNLFQQKNRITYVKTRLPLWILVGLKLNDRLIIRDHKYIINTMTTNLSKNEVDLVLLNDFRPNKLKAIKPIIKIPVIKTPIFFANGVKSVTVNWSDVDVTVNENTYVDGFKLNSEGMITINTSLSSASIIELSLDSEYTNGTIESDILTIYEP